MPLAKLSDTSSLPMLSDGLSSCSSVSLASSLVSPSSSMPACNPSVDKYLHQKKLAAWPEHTAT